MSANLMTFPLPSYHGSEIENYFRRKGGAFAPLDQPLEAKLFGLFLCFTNRCGSTLVASEASTIGYCGSPNTHLNYEFFNSDFVEEFCETNSIATFSRYVDAVCEEFRSPLNIFLTKGSLDQLAWLKRSGVIGKFFSNYRYLRVIRRDLVAQAVSFVIAEQTGQWTHLHKATSASLLYDHQRIANALSYFAKISAETDIYFSILDAQPSYFVYEDVLVDLAQVGEKLQRLTGIEPLSRGRPTLDLQKQSQNVNLEWAKRFRDEVLAAQSR